MKPRRRTALLRAAVAALSLSTSVTLLSMKAAPAGAADQRLPLSGRLEQGGLARGIVPQGIITLSLDGKPVTLDGSGRFVLGFDRDQAERAVLVAHLRDGRSITQNLAITPRRWRIEHIDTPRRPGGATADYLRRREAELARIAAARARVTSAPGWTQTFVWPARGRISGRFGSQRVYRGEPAAFHSGLDIAPGAGAAVVAPADGVVVLAGPPMFSLEGNLVIIDHGMGLNSAFLHLAGTTVREGQVVRRGQGIGTVGATGRATGPHLHWSVKWNEARLDPERLVGRGN